MTCPTCKNDTHKCQCDNNTECHREDDNFHWYECMCSKCVEYIGDLTDSLKDDFKNV